MTKLQEQNEDRALDRWARSEGYADFDTYVRIGGSWREARRALRHRIEMAQWALAAISRHTEPLVEALDRADQIERTEDIDVNEPGQMSPQDERWSEGLRRAEAEQNGDPVDPGNAQTHGFDR